MLFLNNLKIVLTPAPKLEASFSMSGAASDVEMGVRISRRGARQLLALALEPLLMLPEVGNPGLHLAAEIARAGVHPLAATRK